MAGGKLTKVLRWIGIYAAACLVVVIMAFPLYALLLTSLQPESVIRSRNVEFLPSTLVLDHFVAVLTPGHIVPLREGMMNSLTISTLTAFASVLIALPAAYAFSRLNVPKTGWILGALVAVYFLPTTLFLIPIFIKFVEWRLNDTFASLILPYVGFILPFEIWILKTFVDRLPIEVEEAARIDGASYPQLILLIVVPLLRPGILAGFVFAFILSWIEFLTPLIFTNSLKITTVALGLFRSTMDIQIGQQAAAAVLTLLPVALLMLVFQSLITKVVMTGADK